MLWRKRDCGEARLTDSGDSRVERSAEGGIQPPRQEHSHWARQQLVQQPLRQVPGIPVPATAVSHFAVILEGSAACSLAPAQVADMGTSCKGRKHLAMPKRHILKCSYDL